MSLTLQHGQAQVEVVSAGYGGIFVQDGSAAQTGITTSFTKLLNWVGSFHSDLVTPDPTNNQMIAIQGGDYFAFGQFSFSGTANVEFEFQFAVDDVLIPGGGCHRKLGAGGDVGSASFFAVLESLHSNAVVSMDVKSDNPGGAALTLRDAQLMLFRVHA